MDLAAALHLAPSRFTAIYTVPTPLMMSVDMKPVKGTTMATQAYIWKLQQLEKDEKSALYQGVYTQFIDRSMGLSYTSVYHCDSDVILTPPVISHAIENTPEALSTPIEGSFKISSSTTAHDMFLYHYEFIPSQPEWITFKDLPTSVNTEGTTTHYVMDPSKAAVGMQISKQMVMVRNQPCQHCCAFPLWGQLYDYLCSYDWYYCWRDYM